MRAELLSLLGIGTVSSVSQGVHCEWSNDQGKQHESTPSHLCRSLIFGFPSNGLLLLPQRFFLAGLKPPGSKVPALDPYRYRQLLLDRWINRASKRLGDLASLKYGSVKEFFRVTFFVFVSL